MTRVPKMRRPGVGCILDCGTGGVSVWISSSESGQIEMRVLLWLNIWRVLVRTNGDIVVSEENLRHQLCHHVTEYGRSVRMGEFLQSLMEDGSMEVPWLTHNQTGQLHRDQANELPASSYSRIATKLIPICDLVRKQAREVIQALIPNLSPLSDRQQRAAIPSVKTPLTLLSLYTPTLRLICTLSSFLGLGLVSMSSFQHPYSPLLQKSAYYMFKDLKKKKKITFGARPFYNKPRNA
ncbi:hypothetical protein VTK26DRAFT_5644 [Humicola hyalothermophila]